MLNYFLAFLGAYKPDEKQQADKQTPKKQRVLKQPEISQDLIDSVNAAKEEWLAAQIYFENVSEPDLVDFSIYKLEAAKRKYMYLLKLARNEELAQVNSNS